MTTLSGGRYPKPHRPLRSGGWGCFVVLLTCGPLLACAGTSGPISPDIAPRASEAAPLLKAFADRYSRCRSYEDKGIVTSTRRPDDGSVPVTSRIAFRTAFDRERNSFRFEYDRLTDVHSSHQRAVVWRRGAGLLRTWASWRPEIGEIDIRDGIEALAGVSDGTAHYVPPMLLGWASSAHSGLFFELEGDEHVGDAVCTKLSARHGTRSVTLWIAKTDHSLRRLVERDHLAGVMPEGENLNKLLPADTTDENRRLAAELVRRPRPFSFEDIVEYVPVFDGIVPAERFEFTATDPPKQ